MKVGVTHRRRDSHGDPVGVVAGAELLERAKQFGEQTQRNHHRPAGGSGVRAAGVCVGGVEPRRLPVVGQVVEAALDEAHADLPVREPTDQRAQQLLRFVDQTFRQVDLKHTRTRLDGAGGFSPPRRVSVLPRPRPAPGPTAACCPSYKRCPG